MRPVKAPYRIPSRVFVETKDEYVLMWRPAAMDAVNKKEGANWPARLISASEDEEDALAEGKKVARAKVKADPSGEKAGKGKPKPRTTASSAPPTMPPPDPSPDGSQTVEEAT